MHQQLHFLRLAEHLVAYLLDIKHSFLLILAYPKPIIIPNSFVLLWHTGVFLLTKIYSKMKKQLIIGLGALLLSNALMAQHFFDICEDKLDTERYMDPPTDDYNFDINANYFNTTVQVNSCNGEYQIFANKIACEGECESLSYKIELISFPFYPDCIASDCGSDESTVRQLKTFGDASYSEEEKAWVMNFADDRLAQKVFFGDFVGSSVRFKRSVQPKR